MICNFKTIPRAVMFLSRIQKHEEGANKIFVKHKHFVASGETQKVSVITVGSQKLIWKRWSAPAPVHNKEMIDLSATFKCKAWKTLVLSKVAPVLSNGIFNTGKQADDHPFTLSCLDDIFIQGNFLVSVFWKITTHVWLQVTSWIKSVNFSYFIKNNCYASANRSVFSCAHIESIFCYIFLFPEKTWI